MLEADKIICSLELPTACIDLVTAPSVPVTISWVDTVDMNGTSIGARVTEAIVTEVLTLGRRHLATNLGMSKLLAVAALNLAPCKLLVT